MASNKRFFKTISLAHWHDKLSIAAQLPMVHSFRWEQTCELVINVKNKRTDVVFLDFTKAFDSVPHERLLLKLKGYGIEGNLLKWFRNFLTNRQQRVVVRGTFSSWTHVKSGVPQGTILGPILFLIYVNDISSNISSSIKMFADDTKVYREITDFETTLEPFKRIMIVWRTGRLSGSLDSIQRNVNRCV